MPYVDIVVVGAAALVRAGRADSCAEIDLVGLNGNSTQATVVIKTWRVIIYLIR